VKDARFLIRLANDKSATPVDQESLLVQARSLAAPLQGKVINLRVTPLAFEFDLFCSPDSALEDFFEAWKPLGRLLSCKRLDVPPLPVDAQKIVTEARELFNEHRFWEVHEVLEGLWKERQGAEKQLVQGLILTAAALVHVQKNEMKVVWPMLEDALRRLENQPTHYYGWNIQALKKHFRGIIATREIVNWNV
jgi:hypothetical protein